MLKNKGESYEKEKSIGNELIVGIGTRRGLK